jgi:hypothetical protein
LILIATNARDLTSDFVVLALEKRGLPFVRLNTESLASCNVEFRPSSGETGWIVHTNAHSISFSEIRAGYFRRPEMPAPPPGIIDPSHKTYCAQEWAAVLVSALRSLGERWLNSPVAIIQAENKPKQLAEATKLGLRVPETIISNSFSSIRRFVSGGASVAKPLTSSLIGAGDSEQVIFTNRITLNDLTHEAATKAAPFILQREVPKRCDLRVTVVGTKVFSAEITPKISRRLRWTGAMARDSI